VQTKRAGVTAAVQTTWPAGRTIATGDLDGDGQPDVVLFDQASGLWVPILRR